jgi:excisionase family DNA binding protein
MQLFTTAEAAAYLRLKERKIYEMVRAVREGSASWHKPDIGKCPRYVR